MELWASPFGPRMREFMEQLENDCVICSPFITLGPARELVQVAETKGVQADLRLEVITDISVENVLHRATDLAALQLLADHIPHAKILYLPGVHAKVYVSGDQRAIVSSANFTEGGFNRNLEYGVAVSDPNVVRAIRCDLDAYAQLGAAVSRDRLQGLSTAVESLRAAVHEEQLRIKAQIRRVTDELRRETEDELIRLRVHGRSVYAIFAETMLYLLRRHALTTAEIHAKVQDIHPDLCDDTADRVIDGQHYGKLWKHQVRTAQQHLKARGLIGYDDHTRTWSLTPQDEQRRYTPPRP